MREKYIIEGPQKLYGTKLHFEFQFGIRYDHYRHILTFGGWLSSINEARCFISQVLPIPDDARRTLSEANTSFIFDLHDVTEEQWQELLSHTHAECAARPVRSFGHLMG
jgi:hypothetical protein